MTAGYPRSPHARRIGLASSSVIPPKFRLPDVTAGYPRSPFGPPDRVGIWLGHRSGISVTGHDGRVPPVAFWPAGSGWRLTRLSPRTFGSPDIASGYSQLPFARRIGLASGRSLLRPFRSQDIAAGTLGCLQTRRNGLASGSVIAPALPVTGHRGRVPSVASRPAGTGWHLARSFLRTFGSPDMTAGYPRSPPAPPNRVGVWLGYQSSPSSHRTWRPGTLGCLQTRRVGLASGSDIPLVLQVTGHRGRVLPVALSPAGSGWRPARSLLGPSEHRTSRPGTLGCLQTRRIGLASGSVIALALGSPDMAAGYPRSPPAPPDRVGVRLGHSSGPSVTGHHGRVPPVAFCPAGSGWLRVGYRPGLSGTGHGGRVPPVASQPVPTGLPGSEGP